LYSSDETVGHLYIVAKKIALALQNAVGAEGINIHTNTEEAAGQVVFHTHIHVIPRYASDGLKLWHADKMYEDGQQEILAEKIRNSL
jgi:histidine triad (HIT) family protein